MLNLGNSIHSSIDFKAPSSWIELQNVESSKLPHNEIKNENIMKRIEKFKSNYVSVYTEPDPKFASNQKEWIFIDDLIRENEINQTDLGIFMTQMIYALFDIHKSGIVHGDIKPGNFIKYSYVIKLIDFDISCNRTNLFFYCSLDTLNRRKEFNTDIYSLGLTFYFMETGIVPYDDEENDSIETSKKNEDPLRFPFSANLEMKYMISFMTRRDPNLRPSTNLLMLIAHEKAFLPSLAHPNLIPEYEPSKIEYELRSNKKIMEYEWIDELCKDLFKNKDNFKYKTAKEIRRDLSKRIKVLRFHLEGIDKRDINLNDDKILKQYLTMELLQEIKDRLIDEPIVASLFYPLCYQKSMTSNYTIIPETVFDTEATNKKRKEEFVFPQSVINGEIALDYTDFMIESFEHFKEGCFNAFPKSKYLILQRIFDRDDLQELNYIIGKKTRETKHDYTSIFKNELAVSPITSTPSPDYSEESIMNFYQILHEDEEFTAEEYIDDNKLLYALYPTLMFFPSDSFKCIAQDPIDMIYYANWMITSASSDVQCTEFLCYRLFFLMKELTDGIHVKQDLALASEFAELIPDECFEIENVFNIKWLTTFINYTFNSKGAAVDENKFYRYTKLLGFVQKDPKLDELIRAYIEYIKSGTDESTKLDFRFYNYT